MEIIYNFHGQSNIKINRKKTTEKFKKLLHFEEKIQTLNINIQFIKSHIPTEQYAISTKLQLKHKSLHIHAKGENLLNTLDCIYHRLQNQIKKIKAKKLSHRASRDSLTKKEKRIIKTTPKTSFSSTFNDKYCLNKPVSIDEAIKELEEQTYPFIVFRNMNEHEKLSVLYKNGNKRYNIIET